MLAGSLHVRVAGWSNATERPARILSRRAAAEILGSGFKTW